MLRRSISQIRLLAGMPSEAVKQTLARVGWFTDHLADIGQNREVLGIVFAPRTKYWLDVPYS